MMTAKAQEKLCLRETNVSVTSISTVDFVPQPVNEKSHFIRNRIFVGNFPFTATQKDIGNVFRPFGEIIETNIIDSPNCSNRYGFVTFQSIASADAVLSLFFRGREFLVKGQSVNINRALFKPKRQMNGSMFNPLLKKKSVLMMHGHSVLAEFVNGTAYFRPMKSEQKLHYSPEQNDMMQKSFNMITFPVVPVYSNQYRFQIPKAINLQQAVPVPNFRFRCPNVFTNYIRPHLMPMPAYPNFQQVPQQVQPVQPIVGGGPCYGSMPVPR